jgi:ankyrin repeat protein
LFGWSEEDAGMGDIDGQLRAAAKCGSGGDVVALIAAGADPKSCDAKGVTPLMEAIRKRHFACFMALLPHSDPEAVDANGSDALMYAGRHCDLDFVGILAPLSDMDRRDHKWLTAYDYAKREELEISASAPLGDDRSGNKRL